MNTENTEPVGDQATEEKAKRTRRAPEKPFMVQSLVEPNLKTDNDLWFDVEIPAGIKNTAAALKFVESDESLPAGRYRVFQLCADQVKAVEEILKTSMKSLDEGASPEVQ